MTNLVAAPTSLSDINDDEHSAEFTPLTREEAQQLRRAKPALSLWAIVIWQALAGIAVVAITWLLTGQTRMSWSAGYGALAVIVPAALLAYGLSRQRRQGPAGPALVKFFVWEMGKIALTVAMLLAAPQVVVQLSWLALLAGFVVTMKVYWVAMWLGLVRKSSLKN